MVHIKSSTTLRKNYNEISELCKRTGEPIYITKNGESDLVVMDAKAFAVQESKHRLFAQLRRAEKDFESGRFYTLDETEASLKKSQDER